MKEFEITSKENPNHYEQIGLYFEFYEKKIRGSDEILCIIQATEEGTDGIEVNSMCSFKSWEEMKKEYPTLKSLLVEFSRDRNWTANWRDNERVLYVASVVGNEGLYDVNKIVFYDYEDESDIVEFEVPKKSTKKMKK